VITTTPFGGRKQIQGEGVKHKKQGGTVAKEEANGNTCPSANINGTAISPLEKDERKRKKGMEKVKCSPTFRRRQGKMGKTSGERKRSFTSRAEYGGEKLGTQETFEEIPPSTQAKETTARLRTNDRKKKTWAKKEKAEGAVPIDFMCLIMDNRKDCFVHCG